MADVKKRVLPNGMTLLVREDFSAPLVCLNFFVKVGSNTETDDVWGWSHGIEHMLFKGTARRGVGDIAREVRQLGGDLNAGTGYETTNYYIVLPVEGFEAALDIHADALANSAFREEDLAAERRVLIEEYQMYRDVPEGFGFTWDELLKVAFTRHRYKRSIIGTVAQLEGTPRERIVEYFRQGYVPENTIYVVSGAVKEADAFAALERALGSVPARPSGLTISEREPEQTAFRYASMTGDVELAYTKIAFHIPEELHADTPALKAMASVLGSGRSSRLYQNVLERKGLCSSVSVMDEVGREPGVFVIDVVTRPEDTEAALVAIYEEIERLREDLVAPEELEKVLNNEIVDFLSALETVQGQATVIGRFEVLGGTHLIDEHVDALARVTAEDVRRVARHYLAFDRSTVFVYGPGARTEADRSGEAAMRERLMARIPRNGAQRTSRSNAAAPAFRAPRLSAPTAADASTVSEVVLSNGRPLIVRPRRKVPLVALAAYGRAGIRHETPHRLGVGTLMSRALLKGTARRSNVEIAEEIDRYGITLSPFTDRDTIGFYVEATRDQLDRALALFSEVLTEPAFASEPVERERQLLLMDIEQEQDDTMTITMEAFRRRLFGAHPYAWNPLGTAESVAAITREDLVAWHRRFFVADNLSFAVVGDVDPAEFPKKLERCLAGIPKGPAPEIPTFAMPRLAAASVDRLEKDKEQSVVILGVPAPSMHSPDRFAHKVLNAVLSGMGARLFAELRDKRHLCYYTGSTYLGLDDAGLFAAFIGTSPELVDGALDALRHELERIKEDPPTAEEMGRAINGLTGAHLIGLQRSGSQASAFARASALGLGHEAVLAYPDHIRAVGVDEVVAAARGTLDLSRAAIAILSPAGSGESQPAPRP